MSWLAFLLLSLASWRSWVLVSRDAILDNARGWILRRLGDRSQAVAEFMDCPYCCGFWISGGWVTFWHYAHGGSWAWWAVGWWAVSSMVVAIEIIVDAV